MAFSTSFSSIWSIIIKEVNSLKAQGVDLLFHCKVPVGNGLRTCFWNDPWIGDTLLKHLFSRLYALKVSKQVSVIEKFTVSVTGSFRRVVRGGVESHQLSLLTNLLDTVIFSNMKDRWFFDLNRDGRFCVKDVRCLLDDVFLPKAESKWATLSDYYHKLISLWREYDDMVQLSVCTYDGASDYKDHAQLLKLMQFVMGLDDVYTPIRSTNLTTDPLHRKVLDPKVVSDYHPISLIGSLYKVITKILATLISLVMTDLIFDVQTAFLPNRQIFDSPFIVNEILSRCKAKNHQAMFFK
nr:hypothetical protein [Tanacetum cinerariifolium]